MRPSPLLACLPLALAAGEAADQKVPVVCKWASGSPAAALRCQVQGAWDRPVGEGITLCGQRIAARLDAKGALELDQEGKGVFRAVPAKGGQVPVRVKRQQDGKEVSATLTLQISKRADGTWVYRNASALGLMAGGEALLVVDVDGDGAFNSPGRDGLLWLGQSQAFPLPAASERWCTAKLDLTGLSLGPWGEGAALLGRALATTVPEALPVLQDVNRQRALLGLTPRPENPQLSADLQKHCRYLEGTGKLAHPEDKNIPGYTPEGHAAGMRSILGMGTAAEALATVMVATFYHRQDVIRPNTSAFGVGYADRFGGIDGRTDLDKKLPVAWPVLCPAPQQTEVPLAFAPESPDPIAGDREAGFPVTAYFGSAKLKLTAGSLAPLGPDGKPGPAVDCYRFDAGQGGDPSFNRFQRVVALIAKDPLRAKTTYQVRLAVEVDGQAQELDWKFATGR